VFVSCAAAQSDSAIPPAALETVRRIAIQQGGRVKPLDSFARETLDRLSGSPRWKGQDPVETLLSILSEPDRWQEEPLLSVPFGPLREALGLGRRTARVSYSDLLSTKKLMRMLPPIVEKQQRSEKLTMLENETMDLFDRFVGFTNLIKQEFYLVPPASGSVWLPVQKAAGPSAAWGRFIAAVQSKDAAQMEESARSLSAALQAANPSAYPASWRLRLEVFYNRAQPFRIARLLYLAAALFLLLSALRASKGSAWIGTGLFLAALLIHAAGISLRVILGGRPPVSNFYETMLWLPFVAAVLALVFERIYRSGLFGFSAALLASVLLLLADHLPLDSSISPVVAVLRSNLWLTIHVLTVVGSYAPLSLGMVLAHLYGVFYLQNKQHPSLPQVGRFLYRAIQVGVVMLAAGIMLGAVWANASWGRYWGWDPKETWALITLLWFLALLHGRFAGWLQGPGLAVGTIAGFFLVLMTYYGVSFYLVGLHSYAGGNAKPVPPLLVAYFAAELAFIARFSWKVIH